MPDLVRVLMVEDVADAEALRIAMLEAPDTPVIVVTGSLDEETAAEYIKAGAADYVVKHHLERVGPAVLRALDLRRARAEQARAEEARRQGEERFRARIEHGADVVALVAPDGTLLFASHSIERDRKSTRLNSSHVKISYAVFCL